MTNETMTDDDLPATRRDLRELRTELKTEISELRTEFGELRTELKTELAQQTVQIEARLSAELAQHTRAIMEDNRATMRAMLDPYVTLPTRVDRLEAAVFAPKPKRRRATARR